MTNNARVGLSTGRKTGLKIGVIKPDYSVRGGFESLLDRLTNHLAGVGHELTTVLIPGQQTPRPIWGQMNAASRWYDHPDFFNYLGMVQDTRRLDLDQFDLVISTQPPSYLAPHHRVLALFYHQARTFYELSDLYIDSGLVDESTHRQASKLVRKADGAHLAGVSHWLAGSKECRERIIDGWPADTGPNHGSNANADYPQTSRNPKASISILDAPPLSAIPNNVPAWDAGGPVLCVSRHEWPKRTELVVGAGHILGQQRETHLIGSGGRLGSLKQLDLDLRGLETSEISELTSVLAMTSPTTANVGLGASLRPAATATIQSLMGRLPDRLGHTLSNGRKVRAYRSPVQLRGSVNDADRDMAYSQASVVVAPAYREDYGLTALEAMVWGRPVVVCRDGGGLVELVEQTGAGIVVDPTASAIADGVSKITSSPQLAADLIGRAKEVAGTYTWKRAYGQFDRAVAEAVSI